MNEEQTEARIDSAAKHAKRSNSELFVAGYQAAKVYGLYEEAATEEIARRAGRSRGAVQNWVYAYRCFSNIAQVNLQAAKDVRRNLTMTHFREMYQLAEKYEIEPRAQLRYLITIYLRKIQEQTYGPEILVQEVLTDYGDQEAANWKWYIPRIDKPITALGSFGSELPPALYAWAREWQELKAFFDDVD